MTNCTEVGRAAGLYFGGGPRDRLLNEHEAAAFLGLAVATLRRWRWSGGGPEFCKLGSARGSAVRYSPAALSAFVLAGTRSSTSDS
jgi:hypothetical protein